MIILDPTKDYSTPYNLPASQDDRQPSKPESKPTVFTILSILIFIIAATHALSAILYTCIWMIMERAISFAGSATAVIDLTPMLVVGPVIHSIFFILLTYAGIKVFGGSRFSFWFALCSLVASPVAATCITEGIKSNLQRMSALNDLPASGAPPSFSWLFTSVLLNPMLILLFITLIILVLSIKKFRFSNSALSVKTRIVLIAFALILLVPEGILTSSQYLKSKDTDLGYTEAQKKVGFHIYRPFPLPKDLEQEIKYMSDKEMAGKNNAVNVAFNTEITKSMQGVPSKILIMQQVGVAPGFENYKFISTISEGVSQPEKIELASALGGTAYLTQKQLKTGSLKWFSYVTKDNVLILLISFTADKNEFVQFAGSLK